MSCCELCTSERQGEKEKFALLDGEMGKVEAQNKKRPTDVVEPQHLMTNVGACSACVVQCSLEIEMRLAESCDVIICSVKPSPYDCCVAISREKSKNSVQ